MILNFYHLQVFSIVSNDFVLNEININDSELASISWRINENSIKLYNSKFQYNLDNLPFGYELNNLNIYWFKIENHQPWVLVTKVSIHCESINFENSDTLGDWFKKTLHQFRLFKSVDISGVDNNNRTSSTICITDDFNNEIKKGFNDNRITSYGPHSSIFSDFMPLELDSFWIVSQAGTHRSGGSIFNGQTVFYFFLNILIFKHILSDVTIKSLPHISELKKLEKPKTRSILLDNYRIFLSAKIYFSPRSLVKYWDHDDPIITYFFENYDIQFAIDETDKEMNGIVELGSHAAAISAANSSYNTSIAATIIGLIGIIGTLAGIISAIDNPILPVPFETRGSIIRLSLIIGTSLIMLFISGLFILFREKLIDILHKYFDKFLK
jgi:hypothetical protein